MEGPSHRWWLGAVSLVVVCALALVFVGPAAGLSPPPCNEATGMARLDDGGWVVTSWDRIETFEKDWKEGREARTTHSNRTFGVARGPNGSLWLLQKDRVRRLSESLDVEESVSLPEPVWTEGEQAGSADLAYAGRWLVLDDGNITSYNARWGDRDTDPQIQTVVPNDTRGLYATGDGAVFVTGNGTLVGAPRQANGTVTRGETVSVNVADEAVDVHPSPDGKWLIVQPGNVTAYDRNFTRLGQHADVFSPGGCNQNSEDYGWGLGLAVLVPMVLYGLALVLVVGAVVVLIVYLR